MQLNFKKFGEQGTPLVILHGLLGSLDNWQSIAKQLSQNFQVYILDQRNHGRSPHTDAMSYELMRDDLYEFFQQNNIKSAIVIGHSMGGKVAMLFALDYPELVEKLIVVDIAPDYYEGGHESILFAMAEAPVQFTQDRKVIDSFLEKRIPEFAVRQFVLKNLNRNEKGELSWKCNLELLIKSYRQLMDFPETEKHYQGEAYFIKGELSNYISENSLKSIYHFFPKAQLNTIPNAGHWVHAENPEAFLFQLKSILKINPDKNIGA